MTPKIHMWNDIIFLAIAMNDSFWGSENNLHPRYFDDCSVSQSNFPVSTSTGGYISSSTSEYSTHDRLTLV